MIIEEEKHIDAKSRLQELVQEQQSLTPHYQTQTTSGPDHDRMFVVGVYFGDKLIATGEGTSKREAEMAAAAKALATLDQK